MPIITIQNAGTTSSVAPPIGTRMRMPEKIPRMLIQRGISPTRKALMSTPIMPAARASAASRSRYSMARFAVPSVSALLTAWIEKSWPTENLCVSIALTTWWATLSTASVTPPTRTRGRASTHVAGRRKRVASSSSSRISVRAAIASPASVLPAISAKAWWLKNLTSGVRGLTAGLASPRSAGVRACTTPTVGAPFSVEVMMIALRRYRKPPAKAGTASRLRRCDSRATCSLISFALGMSLGVYDAHMESGGLGDLFGDPEDLQRRLAEFAEQMQGQQRLAWADNAIKLAVDMTVAAVNRVNVQGNAEAQAEQIRAVIATVFPEAVALVREAREGLQ